MSNYKILYEMPAIFNRHQGSISLPPPVNPEQVVEVEAFHLPLPEQVAEVYPLNQLLTGLAGGGGLVEDS